MMPAAAVSVSVSVSVRAARHCPLPHPRRLTPRTAAVAEAPVTAAQTTLRHPFPHPDKASNCQPDLPLNLFLKLVTKTTPHQALERRR
jgi:hypothetical protein